ncbi:hypothetical protein JK202_14040 [Gluconobacter sp. Dm-62]|uniref:hypothetical protein n=1 Tax=Gluconobacter sp. Dm-62 TaxID=2799804 RepID=UPI001B8B69B7|nr:hypothetical protein [Gluconobacter sp. Dm-62]MBS1104112.1 hypothetical protein [Gluconobacter sp. Dm-62]
MKFPLPSVPRSDGPDIMATAYGFVLCVMVLVIALQAAILPAAVWQGDEYDYFANIREHGLSFLSDRLLHWSPRPFSEIAVFAYGTVVNAVHRPLAWIFLALTWLFSAGVAFVPFLRRSHAPFPARLLIAVSIAAIFMLGHPSADLFYWPMGTVAHLPVLAAACGLILLRISESLSARAEALLLTLALTSSEAGVFFGMLWLGMRGIEILSERPAVPLREAKWLALPTGIGFCVAAAMIFNHRMGGSGFPFTPTHGHIKASLAAAPGPFLNTLIALQPNEMSSGSLFTGAAIASGLILKAVLTGAFTTLFMTCGIRPPLRTLIVPAVALAGTMYLTVAAAFYAFGFLCCQRHETFRLDLSILLILLLSAGLSTVLSKALKSATGDRQRATTLQICALAGLLLFTGWTMRWRLSDLSLALAGLPLEETAHHRIWASGLSAGPDMTYSQGTASPAFYYWHWESGTYHAGGSGWDVQSAMHYFGKTTLHVLPPVRLETLPATP